MGFMKLTLAPGLSANSTTYSAQATWVRGNLVRWTKQGMAFVGNWVDASVSPRSAWPPASWSGAPRRVHAFANPAFGVGAVFTRNENRIAGGAETGKVYLGQAGSTNLTMADITPTGINAPNIVAGCQWVCDNFGGLLVFCMSGNTNYIWSNDTTAWSGTSGASSLPVGGTSQPVTTQAVVVTPERFLFALGADLVNQIRWPSQETLNDWVPTSTNNAGDFILPTTGRIVGGQRTSRETVIFTDEDVWTATYTGDAGVYRFDERGQQCGTFGPYSFVALNDRVYWWGKNGFFVYDGTVRPLPCPVYGYLTGETEALSGETIPALSKAAHITKDVWATTIASRDEVWWFYPKDINSKCEYYVCYNVENGTWSFGALDRSAGLDSSNAFGTPPTDNATWRGPTWFAEDRKLYLHEHPTAGRPNYSGSAYVESAPIEISNGDNVMMVRKIVRDAVSGGSGLNVTVSASFQPQAAEQTQTVTVAAGAMKDLRLSGRQVRLKIVENAPAFPPTLLGDFRIDVMPAGER